MSPAKKSDKNTCKPTGINKMDTTPKIRSKLGSSSLLADAHKADSLAHYCRLAAGNCNSRGEVNGKVEYS